MASLETRLSTRGKVSLSIVVGVTLGLLWGTLWLALAVFGVLGVEVLSPGVEEEDALRLAQVLAAFFLLLGTLSLGVVGGYLSALLRVSVAVPLLPAFATAALLAVVGIRFATGEGCSNGEWLPLIVPCGD